MKVKVEIEVPDALIHGIIKEFELANSTNGKHLLSPGAEEKKEAIIKNVSARIGMRIKDELLRKIKLIFLKHAK